MVNETLNYKFKKPDEEEFYDINVQNENWDHVDAVLKSPEGNISGMSVNELEAVSEQFPVPQEGEKSTVF